MIKAIVGFTGFVGASHNLAEYDFLINSSNIWEFAGKSVDLLVVAAGDARKWHANQNPDKDWEHILTLFRSLSAINAKHVILYSTVDVLDTSIGVANEDSKYYNSHPYGRHRLLLELLVARHFDRVQIIRLPGLFGVGLKKNIIFDIKFNRFDQFGKYNLNSCFQYFNMKYADKLIENVIASELPLIHVASEPISVYDLFQITSPHYMHMVNSESQPIYYNFQSKYQYVNPSLTGKEATLKEILEFIKSS